MSDKIARRDFLGSVALAGAAAAVGQNFMAQPANAAAETANARSEYGENGRHEAVAHAHLQQCIHRRPLSAALALALVLPAQLADQVAQVLPLAGAEAPGPDQVRQQRRAFVPGHRLALVHHVVPLEG